MRAFLLQHFESLVMMAASVVVVFAFMRVPKGHGWFFRKPYIAGGIMLAAAAFMYVSESSADYSWKRLTTSDGKASAEFPASAAAETVAATSDGLSSQRTTMKCSVPNRDIQLHLTWTDIVPDGSDPAASQRAEAMKAHLQNQGFAISSCHAEDRGQVPSYQIVADKDGGTLRIRMRIAVTSKSVYMASAVSSSGFHHDPAIGRFLDSFTAE